MNEGHCDNGDSDCMCRRVAGRITTTKLVTLVRGLIIYCRLDVKRKHASLLARLSGMFQGDSFRVFLHFDENYCRPDRWSHWSRIHGLESTAQGCPLVSMSSAPVVYGDICRSYIATYASEESAKPRRTAPLLADGCIGVNGMIEKTCLVYITLSAATISGYVPSTLHAETTDPTPYKWTKEFAGEPLDLAGYNVTFSDDFDVPSVTDERGRGPWFAPVKDPYGAALFDRPGGGNTTYTTSNGVLTIRASRTPDGRWHGGNMQTVNSLGKGFAQQYGYFEARMKFPDKLGAWPAFWLKTAQEQVDMAMIRPEIDVIEWYGGDRTGHHRTVHLRPARSAEFRTPGRLSAHWSSGNYSRHSMVGEWHTYGALITPTLLKVYLDRKEVARFPTLDEFKLAFYPIVSLTLYQEDVAKAVPPIDLEVDYVRIYSSRLPNPPTDFR